MKEDLMVALIILLAGAWIGFMLAMAGVDEGWWMP